MQDTPAASRWTRRTFLGLPIVAWVVMLTAGAALAVIGYVVVLETNGFISTGQGIDMRFEAGSAATTTNTANGSCDASLNASADSLNIQAQYLEPNEYCEVTVTARNQDPNGDGVPNARLQGFDIATNDLPAGVKITVKEASTDFCGTTIGAGGTATVGVRIEVGEDALPEQQYVFGDVSIDGFRFVRADLYDDTVGACS